MEEFYDDFVRMCTDAIELSRSGPVMALSILCFINEPVCVCSSVIW